LHPGHDHSQQQRHSRANDQAGQKRQTALRQSSLFLTLSHGDYCKLLMAETGITKGLC
jgi:hypothetical protein